MQFQRPDIPGLVRQNNVPKSIDDLFNTYMQMRQFQAQEKLTGLQTESARLGLQSAQGQANLQRVQNGLRSDPSAWTNADFAAAAQPQAVGNMGPNMGIPQPEADPIADIRRLASEFMAKRSQTAQMGQMGLQEKQLDLAKTQAEIGRIGAEKDKALAEARKAGNESGNGKQLPPASVLAVTDGATAANQIKSLDDLLAENQDLFGPFVGTAGALNPYATRSQTVNAKLKTTAQTIGKFLEGGVLRKEDEAKYEKMLPQLSDTPQVAKNKRDQVAALLKQKYEADKSALQGSNYDTSGLPALPQMGEAENRNSVLEKVRGLVKSGKMTREQGKKALQDAGF